MGSGWRYRRAVTDAAFLSKTFLQSLGILISKRFQRPGAESGMSPVSAGKFIGV